MGNFAIGERLTCVFAIPDVFARFTAPGRIGKSAGKGLNVGLEIGDPAARAVRPDQRG